MHTFTSFYAKKSMFFNKFLEKILPFNKAFFQGKNLRFWFRSIILYTLRFQQFWFLFHNTGNSYRAVQNVVMEENEL
jgi:hypothetical protein